jgi:hypothetical protein
VVIPPQIRFPALPDLVSSVGNARVAARRDASSDEGAVAGSGLSPDVANRIIASKSKAFQACVDVALRRNPKLAVGTVTVSMKVKASGVVSAAHVSPEKFHGEEWAKCMVSVAQRMVFPRGDGDSELVAPFRVGVALSP